MPRAGWRWRASSGVWYLAAMRCVPVALLCSSLALAQQRLPIAFDAGLAANPTETEQKRVALDGKLPASFALPASFVALQSAPGGVTTPTTTLWLDARMAGAYFGAADGGTAPMQWPRTTACPQHLAFALPQGSLLAAGAPSSCSTAEATVRTALADLNACVDVGEPERYVLASLIPFGTPLSAIPGITDAHTQTIEDQIAFAGAGLSLQPIAEGVLDATWVPTVRSVLWKLRTSAYQQRLQQGRAAYAQALSALGTASCFDGTLAAQVQQLDGELAALSAFVTNLVNDGTARAAVEQQCLGARGRTRPALPFPALTDEERQFTAFWLGGVYWRMRGGGLLPTGMTQTARRDFMRRPFTEIGRMANGTATASNAAGAMWCVLGGDGWSSWMDMGLSQTPGDPPADRQDMYEDLVDMTNRGWEEAGVLDLNAVGFCASQLEFSINKTAAQYLSDDGYDTTELLAGALSMGPCYLYGLNPMNGFTYYTHAAAMPPYDSFMEGFTTHGEFCAGATLALGFTRSLLNGTPSGQPPVNFCNGRACGADQCGTSCGSCQTGFSCDATGQCVMDTGAGGGAGSGGGAQASGGGAASSGGGTAASGGGSASSGGGAASSGGGSASNGGGVASSGGGSASSGGGGTSSSGGGSASNGGGGSVSTGGGTMSSTGGGGTEAQGCGCDSGAGLSVLLALAALRRRSSAARSLRPRARH
jgi:hypothetical protein